MSEGPPGVGRARCQDERMSNADDPRAVLADAERAVAEAARLERLLDAQREVAAAAAAAVTAARTALGIEARDVERLERVSFTRAWAALRGDTDDRLARERAEEQAARFRLGVAADRLEEALQAARATEQRRAELGDVAARRADAQRVVQEWVLRHDGADAATLTQLLRQLALLESEGREVREAWQAATAAIQALDGAARLLSQAGGLATYDTFFDTGILTDLAKRDRMEKASAQLQRADRALRTLTVELGHIGQRATSDLQLSVELDAFDLWFDDIFSSWAVRDQIKSAQARVDEALDLVSGIESRLAVQSHETELALARDLARRDEILRG